MAFKMCEAQKKDIPVILELIRDLADYEKLSQDVVASEKDLENHLFHNPEGPKCFLGFEGERVVGFCLYFYNFSTFLGRQGIYLEDLYVRPESRGKSYGKQMLLELVRIAKEKKFGRVEWSVLNWNTPAIQFYESLGAKPQSEWTVYRLGPDEIERLS